MIAVEDRVVMARPKRIGKTTNIRLSDEAIRWAKIASGYTSESVPEYIARICIERAKQDADRLHDQLKKSEEGNKPTKR